jgi:hypothetical protein
MNPVRYAVSRTRPIFRQDMPKVLAKQFTRKLTQAEWGQLHLGLAKTDLAVLGETLRVRNIREMLTGRMQTFHPATARRAPVPPWRSLWRPPRWDASGEWCAR